MIDKQPEAPDTSQSEPELIIERVDKIYSEWLQRRSRPPVKLERDDESADHPDPKKEE